MTAARTGGDLVLECLEALGAETVVGIPGQHALGLFDAFHRSELRLLSARVENNAGFMADGLARRSDMPAPLLLSTGPGALTALPALLESASSSIPVIAISAQVPTPGLGGGRHGYLHEMREQSDAFLQVAKHVFTVRDLAQIVPAVTAAWGYAASAPAGPVLVEIPQDVLLASVPEDLPRPRAVRPILTAPALDAGLVERVAAILDAAERPVILAGGGAARSHAGRELLALAESIDAPVFSTFSGRNAVSPDHPLSAGSWLEDIATTRYLEQADVLLVVGSGLGELSSNYHSLAPGGRVIQIDADLGVLGANHAVLAVHADARQALAAISAAVTTTTNPAQRERRLREILDVAHDVTTRIDAQGLESERAIVEAIRRALPSDSDSFWDMTMIAYWAWSMWDRQAGHFATAQGAGGLGYAFPAAIGAASASPGDPVLAVSGDGGAMYGIAELATAVQHGIDVTWLIIDSGGYGVLEEYMTAAFGATSATELVMPDFVALAASFGVPAVRTDLDHLEADLAGALSRPGPAVVVLPARPSLFAPTHHSRAEGIS